MLIKKINLYIKTKNNNIISIYLAYYIFLFLPHLQNVDVTQYSIFGTIILYSLILIIIIRLS